MNNKFLKLVGFLGLIAGFTVGFSPSLQVMAAQTKKKAWKARAVPMAYNRSTNEWSVLVGYDIYQKLWTDFFETANPGEQGGAVAQRALSSQTNGVYNVSMAGAPWYKTPSDHFVHFVDVPFKPGKELYDQARNKFKNDFTWIPASEFNKQGDISRPHEGKPVNVSRNIKAMIQQYLADAIGKLNARRAAAAQPAIQQQPVIQPQPVTQPASQIGQAAQQFIPCGITNWKSVQGAILFYDKNQPYYEFTNFFSAPVNIDGKLWPTTEHYYQAQKFTQNPNLQEQIRQSPSPSSAFQAGQGAKVDPDWQSRSLDTMIKAVRAKFNQHQNLKNMLLSTSGKVLVEDAGARDAFYGAGANGMGCNYLGQILMMVRRELGGN